MNKIIFILIILIILLCIPVGYKFANQMVYTLSYQVAAKTESRGIGKHTKIEDIRFKTAEFKNIHTIQWADLSASLSSQQADDALQNRRQNLSVSHLNMDFSNLLGGRLLIKAEGITIRPGSESLPGKTGRKTLKEPLIEELQNGSLTILTPIDITSPGTLVHQIEAWIRNTSIIAEEGRTFVPFNFTGVAVFNFDHRPIKTRITTIKDKDGYYSLSVSKELLRTIALQMNEELTEAEMTLLAVHPFKLKRLRDIMTKARVSSERFKNQKDIPEDAFRHVLWSYLLTKEFGPEFAKAVTDAHEIGDFSDTEAEHKMDYNNNAIGREYALSDYKEGDILTQLLSDKRVIRTP